MKPKYPIFLTVISIVFSIHCVVPEMNWLSKKQKGYTLIYTAIDKNSTKAYNKIIRKGIKSAKSFFHSPFRESFTIVIHPSRESLDSTWQKDWGMPAFKSECWMVASGVAAKLDMISPKLWDELSCEHHYSETIKTQQLITHELIHVYHGQLNVSPDFSNVEGIDWFVEGLATYASGQCDADRIAEVKMAINDNKIPKSLDNFWTGKIKYGLCGSVVQYIDHRYGRETLIALLPVNKKSDLLKTLKITENELLDNWKSYIQSL